MYAYLLPTFVPPSVFILPLYLIYQLISAVENYTWYQSEVAPPPAVVKPLTVVKPLLVEAVLVVAVLEKKLLQAVT